MGENDAGDSLGFRPEASEKEKKPKPRPWVVNFLEFEKTAGERPEYLIDKLLYKEGLHVLFSKKTSEGKTLLAQHVAMCVLRGEKVFGKFDTKKAGVLIIDNENSRNSIAFRINRLAHLTDEEKSRLFIAHMSRFTFDGGLLQLASFLDENPEVKLIIIDVWRRFFRGDENDATVVNAIVCELDILAAERSICFLLLHHSRKDLSGDKDNWLRGSSDLSNALFTNMYIERVEKKGETQRIALTQLKNRDDEKLPDFNVDIYWPKVGGITLTYAGTVDEKQEMTPISDECADAIRSLPLPEEGMKREEIVAMLAKHYPGEKYKKTKFTESAIKAALKGLKHGRFFQSEHKGVYQKKLTGMAGMDEMAFSTKTTKREDGGDGRGDIEEPPSQPFPAQEGTPPTGIELAHGSSTEENDQKQSSLPAGQLLDMVVYDFATRVYSAGEGEGFVTREEVDALATAYAMHMSVPPIQLAEEFLKRVNWGEKKIPLSKVIEVANKCDFPEGWNDPLWQKFRALSLDQYSEEWQQEEIIE